MNPSFEEAWAESMRLFILNPDLLRQAVPWRYAFIVHNVNPIKSRLDMGWKAVLANENYTEAALRYIALEEGK